MSKTYGGKIDVCFQCDNYSYCKFGYGYSLYNKQIHPDCPLPDYVDVEKLKETIKELGSLVAEGQKTYSEKIAQLTMVEHDLRVMQKERDELLKALEGLIKVAKVAKNYEYQYMNQAVEALAKIKGQL